MKFKKTESEKYGYYLYQFPLEKEYSLVTICNEELNFTEKFYDGSININQLKKHIENFNSISSIGLIVNGLMNLIQINKDHIFNKINGSSHFIYLLEYKHPPIVGFNVEETAHSFLCSKEIFLKYFDKNHHNLCFKFSCLILDGQVKVDYLKIIQLRKDKQEVKQTPKKIPIIQEEQVSSMMPHSGNINYLDTCLHYMNKQSVKIKEVNICFDDDSYKNTKDHWRSDKYFKFWKNSPINVGPYYPRDYIFKIINSEYLIFQDSDDIPTTDRFEVLINEMNQFPEAGMIGSHSMEIDELEEKVSVQRFPLDVNRALLIKPAYSFFHPTSIINKKAYVCTGGFTKWRKFGSDAQFTYKASVFIKIRNTDKFLYIKRKRANSLTTANRTQLGSNIRNFFLNIWARDLSLIQNKKLNIELSSFNESELEPDINFILKRL